ncbi:MAG: hypothetical protein K0S61_4193 [Anaerocolumna sp.]|nr:hypothetical protein [Anaerocolumna sp.]
MRKRTVVIIVSFISAFILMSGGYGLWQKPLIIKGSIEIREVPPPPAINVAPLSSEIINPEQVLTINPQLPPSPTGNVGIVANEDKIEEIKSTEVTKTIDDQQKSNSLPIDQTINSQEVGSIDGTVNQEQVESEATTDENKEEISEVIIEANKADQGDASIINNQNGN